MTKDNAGTATALDIRVGARRIHIPLGSAGKAVFADHGVRHLFGEIEMLTLKKLDLEDERESRRAEDREIERIHGPGTAWRERELDMHKEACDRSILSIGEGVQRAASRVRDEYLRGKLAERTRWHTARSRCSTNVVQVRRDGRHARSHRVVRSAAKASAKACADPDGPSEPPGKLLTFSHVRSSSTGGASC